VEKPAKVKSGDLTPQGFCFFSGHLLLSQTFRVEHTVNRRIVLGLDRVDAVLIKVFINDQLVKNLPWAPYCLDVTDYLVAGENKLSLQLFSGNRNLLGPHHHIDGELYSVGPGSFTGKWSWTERKSESNPDITPEDRLRNFWKDGYCFVRFGI
jgi:hypothetical protein